MIATCFFCQNLMSDYLEGILPSSRHEDIRKHLDDCNKCSGLLGDLKSTLALVTQMKTLEMPAELTLRVTEVSEAIRPPLLHRRHFSRKVLVLAIPVLILFAGMFAFPHLFPWLSRLRAGENSADFVRYFPLLQGANEILDEHAAWFSQREPFAGSLWEEGGLSPEEFEKAFQKKSAKEKEEEQ